MALRRYALIALILAGSAAFAGKRPPSTATFVPEIAYNYNSGDYGELRLSNREGTAAVLVHRSSTYAGIPRFDLAPVDVKRIAFTEKFDTKRVLRFTTWNSTDGKVTVGTPQTLYEGVGNVWEVEFSPDGQRIAFWVSGDGVNRINIYHFADNRIETILDGHGGAGLAWHPSGNFLYYHVADYGGHVYRVRTDAGLQPKGDPIVSYGEVSDIDTSRSAATGDSGGFIVSFRNQAQSTEPMKTVFHADDGQTVSAGKIYLDESGAPLAGYLGHYNCSNTAFIHRIYTSRKQHTGYYDLASRKVNGFSTDNNINFTDWMPCASSS